MQGAVGFLLGHRLNSLKEDVGRVVGVGIVGWLGLFVILGHILGNKGVVGRAVGLDGDDQITVEYKEFGVSLIFTPVVLSDGKISLRVAPSVSDIVSVQEIPSGIIGADFIVPNLSVRKLETTVQLHDGQTLALAGLLQDKFFDRVEKIPGLGDLPILGALFRSSSFQEEKTELMIAVTPHLVKPAEAGSLKFPGDDFQTPNWYEFYLEGRLEGRRPASDGLTAETLSEVEAVDGGGRQGRR